MKIILHGKLARMFGRVHEIETIVPAEAIEGLSRQLPDWPRDMVVDCVGFDTEELLRSATNAQAIHLVPSMCGGGGAAKIIVGVVLVAAAFLLPPGPWSPILLSAGASLILGGVMQLFMKAPTTDKEKDVPASKYLGIGNNTTAIGTYRTLAWGRNRVAGHWLSLQADATTQIVGRFPTTAPA